MRVRRLAIVASLACAGCGRSGLFPSGDSFRIPGIAGFPGSHPTPTPPGGWWNDAYGFRRAIDVTAGSAGMPAGYSVAISLDHAALAGAGRSLADGSDLRVIAPDGSELDRVLDSGSGFNLADTTLWFRIPTALAAGATWSGFLYYGNASAGAAPENPAAVFVWSDGFESGSLASYT